MKKCSAEGKVAGFIFVVLLTPIHRVEAELGSAFHAFLQSTSLPNHFYSHIALHVHKLLFDDNPCPHAKINFIIGRSALLLVCCIAQRDKEFKALTNTIVES